MYVIEKRDSTMNLARKEIVLWQLAAMLSQPLLIYILFRERNFIFWGYSFTVDDDSIGRPRSQMIANRKAQSMNVKMLHYDV